MKKDTSTLTKKITGYSSLAASLLAISNLASAQIVYTDVNPDVTDSGNGAAYDLDLNNDATVDFRISITSNGAAAKLAAEAIGDNAIAGTYSDPYIYPSALAPGDMIGESKTWNSNIGGMTMASSGYFSGAYGEWFGATDKYLGLRIKVGTNEHYGWVRMDVTTDGKTFTIKDYAFESTPAVSIAAGDAGSIGITPVNANGYKIYAFNKQVTIELKNNLPGDITITNLMGQAVKQVQINSSAMSIDLSDLSEAVYLVTIRQDGNVFTQKIVR